MRFALDKKYKQSKSQLKRKRDIKQQGGGRKWKKMRSNRTSQWAQYISLSCFIIKNYTTWNKKIMESKGAANIIIIFWW